MKNYPLMQENISREDIGVLIEFLKKMPRLTQSENVRAFEEEWSRWLGVRHSVFVNSGASSNFIVIGSLKQKFGEGGEIIVPPLTWISDIASVLLHGFTPVFADIDPRHLGMAEQEILKKITPRTKAVFLSHIQGFDALSDTLLAELEKRGIPLVEDVCESHGASHNGCKLGTFGIASCFSFYFAHHMSTIEGGMCCTDDDELYEYFRMYRSHGMSREISDPEMRSAIAAENPQVSPDFTFMMPSLNFRNTEIGGVLGRSQLKRLTDNNLIRNRNLRLFMKRISSDLFRTDFKFEGCSNYAFPLVLRDPDYERRDRLEMLMKRSGIEFRRGNAGGGNQLRQPYLRKLFGAETYRDFPMVEHVHNFGYYIGNYPMLGETEVVEICDILNTLGRM